MSPPMLIKERKLGDRLGEVFSEYRAHGIPKANLVRAAQQPNQGAQSTAVAPLLSIQRMVRPLFGKGEPNPPRIGDHPDFMHLEGTEESQFCPITTLFLDIENSTRLGLLLGPVDAFRIKNAIICMAIEIINAFDGHVHRIMGDAAMAYFGGPAAAPEAGAIDAVNCAAFLQYFFGRVVLPQLNADGFSDPFGIRVGLDYGPEEHVLWSSYGYPGMNEVTATSFYVDVASKLQNQAPRNQIMLGQSMRDFLDFPEKLLRVKYVQANGERKDEPFILPNYTDRAGRSLNYQKFVLGWEDYLKTSAVAVADASAFYSSENAPVPFVITAGLYAMENGPVESLYLACSGTIPKGKWIRFEVHAVHPMLVPSTVRFRVENHGKEAQAKGGASHGNHERTYAVRDGRIQPAAVHFEHADYRGLHYMHVDVTYRGGVVRSRTFGVYVE